MCREGAVVRSPRQPWIPLMYLGCMSEATKELLPHSSVCSPTELEVVTDEEVLGFFNFGDGGTPFLVVTVEVAVSLLQSIPS